MTTLATHYAKWAPKTCWDGAVAHVVPRTLLFVAIRDIPCGTVVTIRGPAGTVQASVEDHGPNCTCPERGVDASDGVFLAVIGPLGQGIGQVEWWVG